MQTILLNQSLRVEKILGEIEGTGNFEYLFMYVSQYLERCITSGVVTPRINTEEILTYLTSTYNGIEMSCIINHCYKKLPMLEWYVPWTQLNTLETTLYYL